jgi:hypothetical protein
MPTYFFHIRSEGSLIEDDEGLDLCGLDRAKLEAIAGARNIVVDRAQSGEAIGINDAFEITGESGEVLLTVPSKRQSPKKMARISAGCAARRCGGLH